MLLAQGLQLQQQLLGQSDPLLTLLLRRFRRESVTECPSAEVLFSCASWGYRSWQVALVVLLQKPRVHGGMRAWALVPAGPGARPDSTCRGHLRLPRDAVQHHRFFVFVQ